MKLITSIELDGEGTKYFADDSFEVEAETVGGRTVLLYFDVEVAVDYYDNYIDGRFESSHAWKHTVSVEYDCGYFMDDGDFLVVTERRRREIEKEVEQLIINEL